MSKLSDYYIEDWDEDLVNLGLIVSISILWSIGELVDYSNKGNEGHLIREWLGTGIT